MSESQLNTKEKYDIAIIGAGPGGCSCAINLANSGLRIIIFEKRNSRKEKICSGGLSDRSINVIKRFPDNIYDDFRNEFSQFQSDGFRIIAPNSNFTEYFYNTDKMSESYLCKREYFDSFLRNKIKSYKNITFANERILNVNILEQFVEISTASNIYNTFFLIAADGANSLIRRKFIEQQLSNNDKVLAIRGYFKNLKSKSEKILPELYFLNKELKGYFWIFPQKENIFNVGMGIYYSLINKRKINIKKLYFNIINENKQLKEIFRASEILTQPQTWFLPLATKKRIISGERFLLVGDAAALVDPLTGEGIGNALLSGEIAANHIVDVFKNNNFSKEFSKKYDEKIYKKLWKEFYINKKMEKLFSNKILINSFVNKSNNNTEFYNFVSELLYNNKLKDKNFNPLKFIKILFFK